MGLIHNVISVVFVKKEDVDLSVLLYGLSAGAFVCLPGWILAQPLIGIVKKIDWKKFPLYLVLGTAVGPLLVTMILLVSTFFYLMPPSGHRANRFLDFPFLHDYVYSLVASGMTSLVYLLLMMRAQGRAETVPVERRRPT